MASEKLQVILELVSGQYKREAREAAAATGHVKKSMADAGKSSSKLTGGIDRANKSLGAMKGLLAAGVVAGVASFFRDSARAASELEQAVGGTEAVFGDASDAIDRFGETSAESIGLAESEFRTATTLIGGQLKRMTGDVDFAAESAIKLTQVGADLAATYGGTTKEAVDAFAAALRGEADPAERFNLNLKVSAVNAKAVELGLAASTSAVDDNAKAQALLALVMEQSADAQGQFAREADSAAGVQQRLNARWEDARAEIGQRLLPVMVDLADVVKDQIPEITDLAVGLADVAAAVINIGAAISQSIGGNEFAGENGPNWIEILGLDDIREFIDYGPERRLHRANEAIAETMRESGDALHRATSGYDEIGDAVGSADEAMMNMANRGAKEIVKAMEKVPPAIRNTAAPLEGLIGDLLVAQTNAENLFGVMKSAADPVFAAVTAWQSYQEAVKAANEDGTVSAIEELGLLEQELDLNAALGELGTSYEDAMAALALATNEPIGKIEELFEALGLIDGKTFSYTVEGQFRTSGTGPPPPTNTGVQVRAHGGPMRRNDLYQVGEGNRPELFMVPGDNGRMFSFADAKRLLSAAGQTSSSGETHLHIHGSGNPVADMGTLVSLAGVQRRVETARRA